MKIILSPQNLPGKSLTLSKLGDLLILNGRILDFSGIPEGATLPFGAVDCEWINGPISRIDGVLHVPLILPLGPIPYPAPPEADVVRYPAPIIVTADGPITLPSWAPPAEPEFVPVPEDAA